MLESPGVPAAHGGGLLVDFLDGRTLHLVAEALTALLRHHKPRVWPSILNAAAGSYEPQPVLVPLERLGGGQGYSGASVLIAYYRDGVRVHMPSTPLVLKIGTARDLREEEANAKSWPRHPSGQDTRFAYPLMLWPSSARADEQAVLIAPFSSAQAPIARGSGWTLRLNDLWGLLQHGSDDARAGECLTEVYDLLDGIHKAGRIDCAQKDFSYPEEYAWYLRDLHDKLRHVPELLFGTQPISEAFGQLWPNPLHVVDSVLAMPRFTGACGAVHGDLHPKNVVLDNHYRPCIIDFGWAGPEHHVVRDYALMDVNLRAMTLPSQVPLAEVAALADAVLPGDRSPSLSDAILAGRHRLVAQSVWRLLDEHDLVADWEKEYLVPLFLVSFGLLKHLDNARNQHALMLTVLCLARRVADLASAPRPT